VGFLTLQPRRPAAAFSPFAVGWHTAVWADDPNWTNPGDGNAVAQWDDGSGNARHLTQVTGNRQPLFRSSVALLNNRAAVDFDGVNDMLQSAAFTNVAQTHSIIWIGKRDGVGGGANNERIIDLTNGGPPNTSLFMKANGSTKWGIYAGSAISSSSLDQDTAAGHAIRVKYAGASTALVVDGTTDTVNPGTGGGTYFTLGCNPPNDISAAGNIHTAFAGLYAGDVTADGNWSSFVTWVSSYYGLTIG
jgi:hypothetical protein